MCKFCVRFFLKVLKYGVIKKVCKKCVSFFSIFYATKCPIHYSHSTATTRVWIEAENHFNAKIQAESLYGRSNIISNPLLVKR